MLEKTMAELGIDLRFNEEATVEKVKELDPYGVVVAVGGQAAKLNIEGIDKDKILDYRDILSEEVDFTGKNVLVIGGGETGLETAEFIRDKDNKVTVVEMLSDVGLELDKSTKAIMLKRFGEKEIPVLTNTKFKEVKADNKAILVNTQKDEEVEVDFDYIISAIGVKNNPEYNNQFLEASEDSIVIGDARKPRNIVLGTREAYDKAFVF